MRRRADLGASGPDRLCGAIAQLSHTLAEGCRRWLTAMTEADRADNEGWVREFVDRPLTRDVMEQILADWPGQASRLAGVSAGVRLYPSTD
jgi:hypothetical protein